MNSPPQLSVQLRLPLDRFDLDVAFQTSHRVTGIFGVSGSGKTTLLETIAGLRRGMEGHIVFGEDVWFDSAKKHHLPPEKRGVGYVPQDSLLFPHRTVAGNIEAGKKRAEKNGVNFQALRERVVRVLDIGALLERNITTLSGGERQRVALGRAICSGPQLLLLDEPLSSLDVGLRRKVLPFIGRVQDEFGLPILLVSHNPIEVQALCDHLIVLRHGNIIARGEPREVLTRPEVFPIAESEGFENILPGTVVETGNRTSIVQLGKSTNGPHMIVPQTNSPVGSELLLSIPAHEIILGLERPQRLSARNILPGHVAKILPVGNLHLVTITLAPDIPPLVAELTTDAVEDLALNVGAAVHIVLKTSAVTLYQ